MATISTRSPTTGYPFANIFSVRCVDCILYLSPLTYLSLFSYFVSDGTPSNSSGVPYMYMTPLDVSVKDLRVCRLILYITGDCKLQANNFGFNH